MKLAKGFQLRKVGGESVVVPEGVEVIDFNKLICLNSSAAYLWNELGKLPSFEIEDVVRLLVQNYEVETSTAQRDAEELLHEWIKNGIVVA